MATATPGHIPDLSASLNENRQCAPLSDLWNLPQSKMFPSSSASSSSPVSSRHSPTPQGSTAPPAPSAQTPAAQAPQQQQAHQQPFLGSLWGQSAAKAAPAPSSSAPQQVPVQAQTSGSAPGTQGAQGTSGSAASGTPQPGQSQSYRGGVGSIWGPRDDFGFRPQLNLAAGSAPANSSPSSAPQTQFANRPGYVPGGWLEGSAPRASSAGPATQSPSVGPVGAAGVPGQVLGGPLAASGRFTSSPNLAVGSSPVPVSSMSVAVPLGSAQAHRTQKKSGRPSTNTELYKTELCASYMSSGGNCPYGEKCQFAHGTQELKTVDRPPKWRSKPCQNWVKTGTCSYNERCCFRHDISVTGSQ